MEKRIRCLIIAQQMPFKIGKVMKEYGYDWTDLEREFLEMSL